jgi:hypothetical protein
MGKNISIRQDKSQEQEKDKAGNRLDGQTTKELGETTLRTAPWAGDVVSRAQDGCQYEKYGCQYGPYVRRFAWIGRDVQKYTLEVFRHPGGTLRIRSEQ